MNKIINSIYLNTQKLLRENEQEKNTIFKNQSRNIVFEDTCLSLSKEVLFEGDLNSILQVGVNCESTVNCSLRIYLNDVIIVDTHFINNLYVNRSVVIDKNNILKIETNLDSFSDVKIVLNIVGSFNLSKNSLINLKKIGDNFYIEKYGYLSQSNDIVSYIPHINNISCYGNVKYYDHNINYENATNNKNLWYGVYINNSNQLVLSKQNADNILDVGSVSDACVLSSNNINYYFNIVYIKGGKLFLTSYNSDVVVAINKQLSSFDNVYFKEVKSISSDVPLTYFWAKTQDDFWYLINIDVVTGDIMNVREYVKCNDVSSYYYNGEHDVIQLIENGIVVEKYTDINLIGKYSSFNYMNVDNAFIFDGNLYLINADIVQETQL